MLFNEVSASKRTISLQSISFLGLLKEAFFLDLILVKGKEREVFVVGELGILGSKEGILRNIGRESK